eukprot:GHVU01010260.1.p2 GENE.GHVU01010260.1~~GHVU01010260.1.p2  ORF type:complete len:463 (+),score=114.56 GHVU01010260.1:457-1845(+)
MGPFKSVPVVEALPSAVSCVCEAGDCRALYVGLVDGKVIRFSVAEGDVPEELADSSRYECAYRLPTRSPVDLLTELAPALLLALSDGKLFVVPVEADADPSPILVAKGVVTLCRRRGGPGVCVASKRKLSFYELQPQQPRAPLRLTHEFATAETSISAAWTDDWVCAGYPAEYALINATTGASRQIFTVDEKAKGFVPIVVAVDDFEFMLVGQGGLGIFYDYRTQQPSQKNPINWPPSVTQIAVSHPYLVGFSPSDATLSVHSTRDQLPSTTITASAPVVAIAAGASSRRLLLGLESSVSCLVPVPYRAQVLKLLQHLQVKQGLDLLSATFGADDPRRVEEFCLYHRSAAWALFGALRFPQAFMHFSFATINICRLLAFWRAYLPPNWNVRARAAVTMCGGGGSGAAAAPPPPAGSSGGSGGGVPVGGVPVGGPRGSAAAKPVVACTLAAEERGTDGADQSA